MAMQGVIFKRPVRIGNIIYPKADRSVEVDAALLKSVFIQALIKAGDIVLPPQAVAKEAEKAPVAKGK